MQQVHLSNQYSVRFNSKIFVYKYQLIDQENTPYSPDDCKDIIKDNNELLKSQLKSFLLMGNILYVVATENQQITMNKCHAQLLGRISPDQPEYLNLISRFFRTIMRKQEQLVKIGNNSQRMYNPHEAVNLQSQNLTIWPGFECILTQNKTSREVCLSIDLAFKIIRQRTVLQEMLNLRNSNKLETMIGQIIMSTYNKKFYKVEKIEINLSPKSTFKNGKTGLQISYEEYYKQRYNVTITNHEQPLLQVSLRNMKTKTQEKLYLVPELCTVTGLTEEIKNNFHSMKAIAQTTKPAPRFRIEKVKELVSKVTLEGSEILGQWGIEINAAPVELQDRYIPPGSIVMGKIMGETQVIDIRKQNLDYATQKPMFMNGNMKNWVLFHTERDTQFANTLLKEIIQIGVDYQLGINSPAIQVIRDGNQLQNWEQEIAFIVNKARNPESISFFLFILPGHKKKAPLYKNIKQLCIHKYPVPSQIIQFETIRSAKYLKTICNKLCTQIVSKTGGIPWTIDNLPPLFNEIPTMIIGYDVHKSITSKQTHLAMCSSFERHFGRYFSQDGIINESNQAEQVEKFIRRAINNFVAQNSTPLQIMVIYRSGYGINQENMIVNLEIPPIQKIAREQNLKILFILVNKKTNARFYGPNQDNPLPGFVVFNRIVNEKKEFYIISQQIRDGTVQPTHYKILLNELEDDGFEGLLVQIRSLTFKLCYLYYNFSGSIKYPAPVRYASKLNSFISERYEAHSKYPFLPDESLVKRNVLYFI